MKKNIALAVTGSIAAYKACDIIRGFRKAGYSVRVLLSAAGSEFIPPLTLATLSENPVITTTFGSDCSIDHVALAPWASAFVVAPATANCMAKCAHGIADDIISTTYLCMQDIPVFFAPAMNTRMWEHPRTVENKNILEKDDFFIEPVSKLLACGERGTGALAPPEDIVNTVIKHLEGL